MLGAEIPTHAQVDHLRERLRALDRARKLRDAEGRRAGRRAPPPSSRSCGSRCARACRGRAARREVAFLTQVHDARRVRLRRGRAPRPSLATRRVGARRRGLAARAGRLDEDRSRSRCSARRSARCGARARALLAAGRARRRRPHRARPAAPSAPARRPEAPPRPVARAPAVARALAARRRAVHGGRERRRSSIARAGAPLRRRERRPRPRARAPSRT